MTPLDNEGRKLEIHFFLGDLRRRIRQITSGTVVEFYNDNVLNEPPILNLMLRIDDYSPEEIVRNLTPLLKQVENINEVIINHYTKELMDFFDLSPYEMISKEIEVYKDTLRRILSQYNAQLDRDVNDNSDAPIQLPSTKYKYKFFKNSGSDLQLRKFQNALDLFIDRIPDQTFLNIFSGTEDEAARKINWKGKQKNQCAYFIVELSRIMGFPNGDHIWLIASKYITFNGQRISTRFRTNYKPNKIDNLKDKTDIDNALKIFSSPPKAE